MDGEIVGVVLGAFFGIFFLGILWINRPREWEEQAIDPARIEGAALQNVVNGCAERLN